MAPGMFLIVVAGVEYFYFIISFYAYLFVTLQSQMKTGVRYQKFIEK